MGFFSSIKNFFGKSSSKKADSGPEISEAEKKRSASGSEEAKAASTALDSAAERPGKAASPDEETIQATPEIECGPATAEALIQEAASSPDSIKIQVEAADISEASPASEFEAQAEKEADVETSLEKEPLSDVDSQNEASTASQDNFSEADNAMLVRLRAAEPRLSAWLELALENVEVADELFWQRLTFLLRALEAPEAEIDSFGADFRKWLEKMEYWHLDEFRSELQYRLALALDLEDEEDERNRLLLKLSNGLAKTRETLGRQLDQIFASHGELDDKFWNELEELFIMSDMGYETSLAMVGRLKERARKSRARQSSEIRQLLLEEMAEIFNVARKIQSVNKPEVILMSGVNGAGKTTTIAKLANRMRMQGKKVLVVAADTFRAAAIEQLQVWAERAGALFHAKAPGADPAAVAWEGLDLALRENVDVVFIDTAGRLQTKTNLMEELGKIRQVLGKKHPGSPHRSILVLDATTGQNALSQAKLFRDAAGVNELILTKIDGTAKGGVALAVALQEKLPISFVGLGEKMEDLRPFNGADYARALLGEEESANTSESRQ